MPASSPRRTDPSAADLARLVDGTHSDPHAILGLHDGVVRAHQPEARAMRVVPAQGAPISMSKVHDAGVFEAKILPDLVGEGGGYRLEADYAGGTFSWEDPYRFWPTLGDVDLHLLGEGRHRRLWRVLGAHLHTHQGVAGTSFAV